MASATGWLRGKVKAVPSGDSLVIMANTKSEIPPEKTITLSSLMAPKLASPSRGGSDEPFAWNSREFLRKLCIGKEVTFKLDYTVSAINREFGSVFLDDKNVALLVVAAGWAKVREQGQQKVEASPFLAELLRFEQHAKEQGLGCWTNVPGATEAAVRKLPPSAVREPESFDAKALLSEKKGKPLEAIVDMVTSGSIIRCYLLPEFHYVQLLVAGVQAPSFGRRYKPTATVSVTNEQNGDSVAEANAPMTIAQRVVASAYSASMAEYTVEPFAREAKHFTEIRVLHRDVRIVLESVDDFSNLIGSVYYPDGESPKDLALELVEHGLALYLERSAVLLEEDVKRKLKNAELQAKKTRLRMWTNYVAPPTNSKPIHDHNFTGKVIEVVSGDCIIVADDSLPFGDPSAERRINLSSIRCPRTSNPRNDLVPPTPEFSEPKQIPDAKELSRQRLEKLRRRLIAYAPEAKELLRTRLIGRQVNVSMEYSRKIIPADGASGPGLADIRVMDFGSVFIANPLKEGETAAAVTSNQQPGTNVAEILVARGLVEVVSHRDFEERSNYYDALLSARSRAEAGKKGVYSSKDPPVTHATDLLAKGSAKKAKDFLPFLQRSRRMSGVVQYVFSGHRYKIDIPKATCSLAFSLSGVRCPCRGEPYSDEAIAFMRRKIMQRDVEIEVDSVDRTGTFLGSLWESRINVAIPLLEAGLAKLQHSFKDLDRIRDAHLLIQAEQSAKQKKLKIWANYVEGEEVSNGSAVESRHNEEIKVVVTEVLGGGKFYAQPLADQMVASLQKQLSSLSLQDSPVIGSYNPKMGDIVLSQFSADDSWNRAMIVNAPRNAVQSANDEFEVFYIDYGNQETVPYNKLRPLDPSVSSGPGLAQLCSLAFIKVPDLEEEYGHEAAIRLSEHLLSAPKEFRAIIEEKDTSAGKMKGQGTGTIFLVTLIEPEANVSVNAAMLQDGLARLEKRRRFEPKDKQLVLDELEKYQDEARRNRLAMWEYGDIASDDEDDVPLHKPGKR